MALPDDIHETTGTLCVVTHAGKFTRVQWEAAFISRLLGEHGDDSREAAYAIAARMGRIVPRDFEW